MKPTGIHRLMFFILSVTVYIVTLADASTVVVESPAGKFQGVKKTDESTGQSHVSFQGIPYAKPPLGDLRFAKPEPHPKIDDIFDASNEENRVLCPHPELMTLGQTGFTEDCLILNVHARDVIATGNDLRKVLVFIHGGGFVIGNSQFYDPTSFVISQDVMVVTINYRLGVLGFMSTEDEASPGNYGLWDQALALKWVKDNIRSFGGDPDDVTIAGESAGGASVGYLILSPHTKGLFTKAYPHSSTSTSIYARSVSSKAHALTIAKSVGCWDKDDDHKLGIEESHLVVECLRQKTVSNFSSFGGISFSEDLFAPRVDGDFVPDLPAKLLQDDDYLDSIGFFDKTFLIAINNQEVGIVDGVLQMTKGAIFSSNETSDEEKESAWQGLLSKTKDLYLSSRLSGTGASGGNGKSVVDKIDTFYNRRYTTSYTAIIEMVTDLNFLIPSYDYLLAVSRRTTCNAFFLYFNHYPEYMKGMQRGTGHGFDLGYWFDIPDSVIKEVLKYHMQGEITQEDKDLKVLFSSIIGQFVRSGQPGKAVENMIPSGWPRFDKTNAHYLNFSPNPWVSSFLEKDKVDFWMDTVPSVLKAQEQHTHSEL